jgi:hypothetical protein
VLIAGVSCSADGRPVCERRPLSAHLPVDDSLPVSSDRSGMAGEAAIAPGIRCAKPPFARRRTGWWCVDARCGISRRQGRGYYPRMRELHRHWELDRDSVCLRERASTPAQFCPASPALHAAAPRSPRVGSAALRVMLTMHRRYRQSWSACVGITTPWVRAQQRPSADVLILGM